MLLTVENQPTYWNKNPFRQKRRDGEETGKNDRGPEVWKGAPGGPDYVARFLSFSVVSLFVHRTLNPFSPNQSPFATEGRCFRCNVKTCRLCILTGEGTGGGGENFVSPGPEPALGGSVFRSWFVHHDPPSRSGQNSY